MNLVETGKLLTFIAELDYRRFTEETVNAWHEILSKYDYQDCREAVRIHNDTSADFLKPGHIAGIIRSNRRRRLSEVKDIIVADIDDPRGIDTTEQQINDYRRTVAEIREALADGTLSRPAYQWYRRNDTPWAEFRKHLGPREPMKAITA